MPIKLAACKRLIFSKKKRKHPEINAGQYWRTASSGPGMITSTFYSLWEITHGHPASPWWVPRRLLQEPWQNRELEL